MAIAGGLLSFGYPLAVERHSGRAFDPMRIYRVAMPSKPADVRLARDDRPVSVAVDIGADVRIRDIPDATVATLSITSEGKAPILWELTLKGAATREDSPQTAQLIYRVEAGTIDDPGDAGYRFTFTPLSTLDETSVKIVQADLLLHGGRRLADPRAGPVGYAMTAVGLIGLLLSSWRRPTPNPNSQPPPRKWGRKGSA